MQSLGKLIDLPKIIDPRGNLTVAQQYAQVPFGIRRVYWTYDVPSGESRGGHAHRHCREFVIAVSGSFDHLNHPYQGLLIETNIWRTLEDFSSGAVCLVLAEDEFDETDYIYDYHQFLDHLKCLK